jgi:formiminotetrahydrofolate cyclodeaminase
MGTFKLPKETDEEKTTRNSAIVAATLNAAHMPLHVAEQVIKVMELALKCARKGNLNAISDSMSGFSMCRASLTAAGYNVRINLNTLEDKAVGEKMLNELKGYEAKADELEKEIRKTLSERGGL